MILLLSMPGESEWFILLIPALLLYFLPTAIGSNTRSSVGIFFLNLLLGWTFVGWIGALIWALNAVSNKKAEKRNEDLINTLNSQNNKENIIEEQILVSNKPPTEIIDRKSLLLQLTQLHDLREKNVITEEIYEQEKNEILTKFAKTNSAESKTINNDNKEETISNTQDNHPTYEELFGKETWLKRNKTWVIASMIVVIFSIGFYLLFNTPKTYKEKIIGSWSVELNEVSIDSLYVNENDDFLDLMKNVKSIYYDFKQDSTINIDIHYIDKDKDEEYNGTYKFSMDKGNLETNFGDNNSNQEYEVVKLTNDKMLLKLKNVFIPLKKIPNSN